MKAKTKDQDKSVDILIVEDSPTQAMKLMALLDGYGYRTKLAENGRDAIIQARDNKPMLIIADILMPIMDGFEMCRAIKFDKMLRDIPVILLTSLLDTRDIIRGLDARADYYVTKPYDEDFLISRIKAIQSAKMPPATEEEPLEVALDGKSYTITSTRQHILNLLLSTYENSIQQNKELIKTQQKLKQLNEQLENKVKRRTQKIEHLNSVLHAIRTVNQIIVKQKDRDRLMDDVCDCLTSTRSYHSAWIALVDKSGRVLKTTSAGLGERHTALVESLERGEMVECGRRTLGQPHIVTIKDHHVSCGDCPLVGLYQKRGSMTARLEHDGHIYGLLSVSIPEKFVEDKEEYSLFEEVAEDIAFALYSIGQETERKRAEDRLRKTVVELERSNTELQRFAYVASHDLQEPLRMISSFTQLLVKRYKGNLDADADDFMHYIIEGVTRMQALINGLLDYSRIHTTGKDFSTTDCEAVLENALANLRSIIEESGSKITHDPLPTVIADDSQLVQLFQNLIGNAIKFRGRRPPRIHISAEPIKESKRAHSGSEADEVQKPETGWLFSVRDNGIGIAPEYHERIFTIFQRLRGRDEYDGTGIGLAICKRIIGRLGGTIWVESEPGNGSQFYFTLPDSIDTKGGILNEEGGPSST